MKLQNKEDFSSFFWYNYYGDNMDGILLIDKKKGCTSREVVNQIVKLLDTKKVGHTGTLDPIATGVLVVCVGKATKLVDIITAQDKEYIASVTLGTLTDTLDSDGNIIKEEIVNLSDNEIISSINSMKGSYLQEVPIYSAVKINGKKLYEYARENIEVELPKRNITVYDISLVSNIERKNGKISFMFKCKVSKGTYIRSLINDIAKKLNTVGIMTDLRRIRQGKFNIDDCIDISQIDNKSIIPVIDVLDDILHINVNDTLKKDILNGKIIDDKYNVDRVLFISNDNKALAIYKKYEKDENKLKPEIMLGGI